jgi:glycosyltransferase involved in cell wall biosynthesis
MTKMPDDLARLRIGYVPYSATLEKPGDRRRFVYYAKKRNLSFEIANPSKKYDVVVITENADLSIWSNYDRGGAKLVYDFIDSYLAIPRTNIKGQLRGLAKYIAGQSRYLRLDHWKTIGDMCTRANAVVCSTEEQRQDICIFNNNVHIILDAHLSVTRSVKTDYGAGQPFRLVWEGLPQTLYSLEPIRPVLNRLSSRYPVEMHVVTDPEYYRFMGQYGKISTLDAARRIFPDVQFHVWNEGDCSEIICSCDVAVIPLALGDPFAAGKPENKLLLFWRMGMPVVTSASPAYARAMQAAGMDLTVRDENGWLAALQRLGNDEAARRNAGTLGKSYVERAFSETSLLARWDTVFASLGIPVVNS